MSVVIPALNEANQIRETLLALQPGRGCTHEIIVVDGGSTDGTPKVCQNLADLIVDSMPGRALQMNAGAKLASNEVLWFVHADTHVPVNAVDLILRQITASDANTGKVWGRFNVRFDDPSIAFSVIAWCMNNRSRLTGIATGDQCLFVLATAFQVIGRYPDQPLMEDIEVSVRLKAVSAPVCLSNPVVTSARRWRKNGLIRTIVLMWKLRLLYFFGASPERLAALYRGKA